MPVIIAEDRYLNLAEKFLADYRLLKDKFPADLKWKKLGRVPRTLKTLYAKDKVYAVKQLNYLESAQAAFGEERRALIVKMIELLQKLILHKKLNATDAQK